MIESLESRLCFSSTPLVVYYSPRAGSDSNTGVRLHPLATLARAERIAAADARALHRVVIVEVER